MSRSSVLEYMAMHMRNAAMCESFLRVAATQYADLLPRVREDVAKAMSVWLGNSGYSASRQVRAGWRGVGAGVGGCVDGSGCGWLR